jgi:hypothetical protein
MIQRTEKRQLCENYSAEGFGPALSRPYFEERMKPYEMKTMILGTVMSFPPTVKISTSLTKVLVQESWSKGMSA